MLLHAKVLHEGEVGPIYRLGPNADLVRLVNESVTVLVGGDIVLFISVMLVDAHVIGDAVMVIAQNLVNAVDGSFCAFPSVGQAEILARMAMEMVFFPQVGVHVLVRVVEVFAFKGPRLLETVGGYGEIDGQNGQ